MFWNKVDNRVDNNTMTTFGSECWLLINDVSFPQVILYWAYLICVGARCYRRNSSFMFNRWGYVTNHKYLLSFSEQFYSNLPFLDLPELLLQTSQVFAPVPLGCTHPGNASLRKLFQVRQLGLERTLCDLVGAFGWKIFLDCTFLREELVFPQRRILEENTRGSDC